MTAPVPPPATRFDPAPGEWQRVSPKYVLVDLVGSLIGAVILTLAVSLPYFFSGDAWWLIPTAAAAVLGIVSLILVPRRARAIGYRLRQDDLVVRRGIMFLRIVAVPYGRMQLVDITRGPVSRAVGLADLKLVTAASASNVSIPGLPLEDAEALRDHLIAVAESRRAGL